MYLGTLRWYSSKNSCCLALVNESTEDSSLGYCEILRKPMKLFSNLILNYVDEGILQNKSQV